MVVADDPVYLNWLQAAAPGAEFSLARVAEVEDLVARIHAAGRVDAVFFEFSGENAAQRAGMIERLLERVPEVAVAALGHDDDARMMQSAMRAGARDFFVLDRDQANVAALLGRLLRRTLPIQAGGARKQGGVFTVMAAVPYDAIAFLAEHLALACAERIGRNERTLLLDMAIPAGASSIFLNLSPTYGVLDALNDAGRCDPTLVDTAFPRHSSGLYVLSLPEDTVGRPMVDAEEFLALLGVLRGLFACIVVTLDGQLPLDVLRGAIATADRSLLVTDQSILKARHSKYLLRALRLEQCPLERVGLVVDNYRRRVGLEPENLSGLLETPVIGTLSTQLNNRVQAMNQGEPMFVCAPKDEYCEGVRQLCSKLLGVAEAKPAAAPGGLLGRLFG